MREICEAIWIFEELLLIIADGTYFFVQNLIIKSNKKLLKMIVSNTIPKRIVRYQLVLIFCKKTNKSITKVETEELLIYIITIIYQITQPIILLCEYLTNSKHPYRKSVVEYNRCRHNLNHSTVQRLIVSFRNSRIPYETVLKWYESS